MDKFTNWLAYIAAVLCITSSQALLQGPWSEWGECSANCDGSQERTRTCYAYPGENCDGMTSQSRSCSAGQCIEVSIILSIVFGILILCLIILFIYLLIKRRSILRQNKEARFNANAAEDYYDRSIVRSSSLNSRTHPTTSSIASSRATIPTIAPYLPDLEEEEDHPGQTYINKAYDDTDSLDKVSFSNESIQEACVDFDVDEVEAIHENASPVEPPKVKMMTFAGTQTAPGEDDDGSDLEVRLDII